MEAEGFHSAQEQLSISTSTISSNMGQLEVRGGFRLIQKGKSLHQTLIEFFSAMKNFQAKTEDLRNLQHDEVHLGMLDDLATDDNCLLHAALSWFYGPYLDLPRYA
ncbi:hypothetical protein [Marinobacter salsuginis]|uniref:hypothetical protein n=1 Tax=Marinobacter salsuginis TaxID=418719 RepID=UPI003519BE48